ncbi:zinc transporter foi-like, partial [Brachionus plicatilis]
MIKFIIPILILILKSPESSQSNPDLDSIILKYSSNNKFQLDAFFDNFKKILNKTSAFECFESNFHSLNSSQISNKQDFLLISSVLVSKLDECYNANFSLVETNILHEISNRTSLIDNLFRNVFERTKSLKKEALFYSFVSVVIISFVGVLCIIAVPVLNNFCFNYLFQFLTALALGTLAGDALLHLVPHAFMLSGSHNHFISHQDNIYKGLAIVIGVYFFFLIENLMKFHQCRREKNRRRRESKKKNSENNKIHKHELDNLIENPNKLSQRFKSSVKSKAESESSFYDNEIGLQDQNNFTYLKNNLINSNKERAHEHSHSHSTTKSSVLMIILGDGLHNFSDGLAIGVSFSSSITTGVGTSLAVFFHELPHEIGDFAVLRKNGYSMRKALLFNILSSILCFIGALIGLLLGSIEQFSNWSFLFIAGSFIYISLVDLIPELNESTDTGNLLILLMQNLGIILGF